MAEEKKREKKKPEKKKAPTKVVRCKEVLRGRRVMHPIEERLIETDDEVELPELLALQLIDRGDFEEVKPIAPVEPSAPIEGGEG